MNNLLKHQKGDIERNKKKNKENKSKYSNILKKRTLLNRAKKNIIALLALKKCECLSLIHISDLKDLLPTGI